MKITKKNETFSFELDDVDLEDLAVQLVRQYRRAIIRNHANNKTIGKLEFSTMQFQPFDNDSPDWQGTVIAYIADISMYALRKKRLS